MSVNKDDAEEIYGDNEYDSNGELYHDENTMRRVWDGLKKAGLSDAEVANAVDQMQNNGILFRERGRL